MGLPGCEPQDALPGGRIGFRDPHRSGLLRIATTNHPDELDPAINNRPGRFDVVIEIPNPSPALRRTFLDRNLPDVDEAVFSGVAAIGERRRRESGWFVGSSSLAETVPSLLAALERTGARLVSLSTHRSTLEDVFISLTGRELRDE